MLLLYSQAGELVWAERELGVGGAFQVNRWTQEGNLGSEGNLWAGETGWAAEATTFTAEAGFENLALLLSWLFNSFFSSFPGTNKPPNKQHV